MIKKYGPLVGLLVLVVATVLELVGQGELASAVRTVGSTVGLTDASPIPGADVTAVAVKVAASAIALYGFCRKVAAEVKKASAPKA